MAKVKIKKFMDYLNERVGVNLYVWGANDESIVTLLPKLTSMETDPANLKRVLTLLNKRLLENGDIWKIRCDDCSGLFIGFALENKILKSDTTADGIYNAINNDIPLTDVQAGDFLFMGTKKKKDHVGYAISSDYAIEARGRDYGVVMTKIKDRKWKFAARSNWFSGVDKYVKNQKGEV